MGRERRLQHRRHGPIFYDREGRHAKGFYYILLPDGRRQIVDYYVDGDSG